MSVFIEGTPLCLPLALSYSAQRRPIPSCSRSAPRAGRLGDLGQELVVVLGGAHLVDEQLEATTRRAVAVEGVQDPAQLPDLVELVALEQQLLVPGARRVHVDRR